jgi:hypothetical protein
MDAFKIIASIEGQPAADAFKVYFDALNLKPEMREKMSDWDIMNPLYRRGFHPALVLHMMEFNKKIEV